MRVLIMGASIKQRARLVRDHKVIETLIAVAFVIALFEEYGSEEEGLVWKQNAKKENDSMTRVMMIGMSLMVVKEWESKSLLQWVKPKRCMNAQVSVNRALKTKSLLQRIGFSTAIFLVQFSQYFHLIFEGQKI